MLVLTTCGCLKLRQQLFRSSPYRQVRMITYTNSTEATKKYLIITWNAYLNSSFFFILLLFSYTEKGKPLAFSMRPLTFLLLVTSTNRLGAIAKDGTSVTDSELGSSCVGHILQYLHTPQLTPKGSVPNYIRSCHLLFTTRRRWNTNLVMPNITPSNNRSFIQHV